MLRHENIDVANTSWIIAFKINRCAAQDPPRVRREGGLDDDVAGPQLGAGDELALVVDPHDHVSVDRVVVGKLDAAGRGRREDDKGMAVM